MREFIYQSLASLATGLITGFIFASVRLPIPAPPVVPAVFGILGITLGYIIFKKFFGWLDKMSPFKKLLESAKTEDEREVFLKMIQMMLCLRKHESLKKLRWVNGSHQTSFMVD